MKVTSAQRLHVTNGCASAPIWIAAEVGASAGPGPNNVRIDALATHTFPTPDGLKAMRMWPKMGCNDRGGDCSLGGSGGAGQGCVGKFSDGNADYSKCGPPVDTKFEASWGTHGLPCTPTSQAGCDFVDMSLVDGYTLPFKFEIEGNCSRPTKVLDCSGLSFERCPQKERLGDEALSLQAVNPKTGQVAGCYSPCSKLLFPAWGNKVREAVHLPYCCPTPPITPQVCRAGPIEHTHFVSLVHEECNGVYAYSYDDKMGLSQCDPRSMYQLTFFCPSSPQPHVTTPLPTVTTPQPEGGDEGSVPLPAQPVKAEPSPEPAAVTTPIPWTAPSGGGPPAVPFKDTAQAKEIARDRETLPVLCVYPALRLCGIFVPGRSCQCDSFCKDFENCCQDYVARCPSAVAQSGALSPLSEEQSLSMTREGLVTLLCATVAVTSIVWVLLLVFFCRKPSADTPIHTDEEVVSPRREGADVSNHAAPSARPLLRGDEQERGRASREGSPAETRPWEAEARGTADRPDRARQGAGRGSPGGRPSRDRSPRSSGVSRDHSSYSPGETRPWEAETLRQFAS